MTPKRKKYLAKCSKREHILRDKIAIFKSALKTSKSFIRSYSTYGTKDSKRMVAMLSGIHENKVKLSAYRHELARLKGMDRVVVPKQTKHEVLPKTTNRPAIMSKPYFVCKCGDTVGFMMGNEWQKATYCTHCGRRILWEKVK